MDIGNLDAVVQWKDYRESWLHFVDETYKEEQGFFCLIDLLGFL